VPTINPTNNPANNPNDKTYPVVNRINNVKLNEHKIVPNANMPGIRYKIETKIPINKIIVARAIVDPKIATQPKILLVIDGGILLIAVSCIYGIIPYASV
jgi:hypothetical protein